MNAYIRPGFGELISADAQPVGFVLYTGPQVFSSDGDVLYMTPQSTPPYLVEWTDQQKAEYEAQNGGDPIPTARNFAKNALDSSLQPNVMAHRAEFQTQFQELNAQVQRITQILVDAGAVNGFAPFQALVASIEQTQPIPPAEQQTRARDFIESGGADTPPV